MSPEQAIKTSFLTIAVNENLTVVRVASSNLTLSGRATSSTIPIKHIGTPVKDKSNNSYVILVPKGEPVEHYIEIAKDMIKDSIQQSLLALQQAIENTHKAADNESEWLVTIR